MVHGKVSKFLNSTSNFTFNFSRDSIKRWVYNFSEGDFSRVLGSDYKLRRDFLKAKSIAQFVNALVLG